MSSNPSKFFRLAALAAVLTASAAAANATELVTNGGFENGLNSWSFSGIVQAVSGNVYASYGWTDSGYTGGKVALFGAGTIHNGVNNGVIAQKLHTVIGQRYDWNFGYGAVVGTNQEQDIDVSVISSNSSYTERFITYGTKHLANLMTQHHIYFTADSTETKIQFFDPNVANGNTVDGAVDNVSVMGLGSPPVGVPAVPEPETYAMMLAGLGALGFAARRRKAL